MKLIIAELEARRCYVSREFFYVMKELMAVHDWRQVDTWQLWNAPGTLRGKLLDRFGELPEAILFWEGYEFVSAHTREIFRLNCKKSILADDLHCRTRRMKQGKTLGFALCDTVLSTYGYIWPKFFPQFRCTKKVVWVPHSASQDFMLPYNAVPDNSILLSGAISSHYPLRQQMMRLHSERAYSITYHGHPGYHCGFNYEADENIGRGYAKKINNCRAGFTDSAKYKYVVAKYFEIPATGALLLADDAVSGPLKKLGFIENQHYVSWSRGNLEEKIRYVLDGNNQEELDEIRRRGQALVWEKHKTSDRARQINDVCSS